MKRLNLKKYIAGLIIGLGCLLAPIQLAADAPVNYSKATPKSVEVPAPAEGDSDDQPAAVPAPAGAPNAQAPVDCTKELLLSFFPQVFVNETLKNYKVPQDQWAAINKELSAKDSEVIKMVQNKASQMDPNPLKDPQQRSAAVKLFKETLFQIFAGVMKAHGVTDDKQIQAMLDDVQKQKAQRFAQCIEQQKGQKGGPAEDSDEDDTE